MAHEAGGRKIVFLKALFCAFKLRTFLGTVYKVDLQIG